MRVHSTRWIAASLVVLAVRNLGGQSVGQMVAYDVLHAGGDIVGTWAAPFHSSGRDWLGAGLVVVGSAAV